MPLYSILSRIKNESKIVNLEYIVKAWKRPSADKGVLKRHTVKYVSKISGAGPNNLYLLFMSQLIKIFIY